MDIIWDSDYHIMSDQEHQASKYYSEYITSGKWTGTDASFKAAFHAKAMGSILANICIVDFMKK